MAVAVALLDVGGVYFKTSISTLNSFPDSFFGRMFSGNWQNAKDNEGRVFIDRDGDLFKYVLDFLRNGPNMFLPDEKRTRERLKVEADFYCLPQLAELLGGEADVQVFEFLALPPVHAEQNKYNPNTKMVKLYSRLYQPNRKPTSITLELSINQLRFVPHSYFSLLADKIEKRIIEGRLYPFTDDYFRVTCSDKFELIGVPGHANHNVMLLVRFLQLGVFGINDDDVIGDVRDLLNLANLLNVMPAVHHICKLIRNKIV